MARKSEAQIRFSANTSEFRNGIKEMNNSIKTMNNELKLNAQQLKSNANDVGLLEDKQRILQQQLEASAQKIQYTEKALEEANKTAASATVGSEVGQTTQENIDTYKEAIALSRPSSVLHLKYLTVFKPCLFAVSFSTSRS